MKFSTALRMFVTALVASSRGTRGDDDLFCCSRFSSSAFARACPGHCDMSCNECLSKSELCLRAQVTNEPSFLCFLTDLTTPNDNGDHCCIAQILPGVIPVPLEQLCFGNPGEDRGVLASDCIIHSGGGGNDPHFKTWTGHFFDYHGECDLVLVSAPNFGGSCTGLRIHIRTKQRYEYSFIESAAVKIGEDILEVSGFGQYMFNGIAQADLSTMMDGKYRVVHEQKNKKEHAFVIHINDDSAGQQERIVVSTFKDWVSVKVLNGTSANFHNSTGLMGRFEDGVTVARDGKTAVNVWQDDETRNAFGQEWQVLDTEPMLFQAVRAPQYPTGKCLLPDSTKTKQSRRLGETIAEAVAEKACAHWDTLEQQQMCIFDVMASGDLEVALVNPF